MYEVCQHYRDRFRAHVLVWEYPGYGCAQGTANEANVNLNAWAVLNYIRGPMQWPLSRLILFGQSIGTGPTCHIAATLNKNGEHLGGVILQSAYTSIRDVIRNMLGGLARVVSNRWSNDIEIKSIRDPILFIHGRRDPLIPSLHSETLFQLAVTKQKRLALCEATHNDWDHASDIIRPVEDFLTEFPRSAASLRAMQSELKASKDGPMDGPPELKLDDKLRIPPAHLTGGMVTTSSSSTSSLFAASLASSRALTARTIAVFSPPDAEAAIDEETKRQNGQSSPTPTSSGLTASGNANGNGLTSSGGVTVTSMMYDSKVASSGGGSGPTSGDIGVAALHDVKFGPQTPSVSTITTTSSTTMATSSTITPLTFPSSL